MDYQKGKIYKIESHLGDKIYIGSTTKEYLSQRMTAHRASYNQWKKGKRRMTMSFELFEEYGIENCNIILLELCPCDSKDELSAKEAHFITTLECVNKYIPGRTQKQFYQDNIHSIKEQSKQYRKDNKDKKKEYDDVNKEYFKQLKAQPFKCECGCTIQIAAKTRHQRTKKHIDFMTAKQH